MGCCAPLTSPSSAFSEIVWSHPFVNSFCRSWGRKKIAFPFFPPRSLLPSSASSAAQADRPGCDFSQPLLNALRRRAASAPHRAQDVWDAVPLCFTFLKTNRNILFWRQTIESGFWRIRQPDASRYEVFLLSDFLEEQREKFGSISLDWHCNFRWMFWIFAGFSLERKSRCQYWPRYSLEVLLILEWNKFRDILQSLPLVCSDRLMGIGGRLCQCQFWTILPTHINCCSNDPGINIIHY